MFIIYNFLSLDICIHKGRTKEEPPNVWRPSDRRAEAMFEEMDGGQATQNHLDKEKGEIAGLADN